MIWAAIPEDLGALGEQRRLGKGQGQYAPAMDCGTTLGFGSGMRFPIIADFDRDGVTDLAGGNAVMFGVRDCNATTRVTRKLTGHFLGEVVTDQFQVELAGKMLFEVLMMGEHALHGFTNRDLRQRLSGTSYPLAPEVDKRPGQVTRLLRRLHAHGLVAKIPHSRRWRASLAGRRTMATAIKLREVAYPSLFEVAA